MCFLLEPPPSQSLSFGLFCTVTLFAQTQNFASTPVNVHLWVWPQLPS